MLITDLTQSGTTLKIIERGKLQALLQEIALGQSGAVDQATAATAIRAGRIMGAQSIEFGSFMVLGPTVRIDTRIINVETSASIMAASIIGGSSEFMQLEQKLVAKIAGALNVAVAPPDPGTGSDISAALYFSRGVEALDTGRRNDAIKLFNKCIKLDPSYQMKVNDLFGS
jgi:hypothetical protein